MPRVRFWKELENGQLDMTTSVLPTPEREQSMWVLNYFQLRSYVILSRPQAGHIKSLEEFLTAPKPLIFGRVRGYKHGAALDAWIGQLEEQGRVQAQSREWQSLIDGMQRDGTMRRLIGKYMDAKETEAMLLK